jgi:hypothetical protein
MLSVGMSEVQRTTRTTPDLPAGGLDLIWEQEVPGQIPASRLVRGLSLGSWSFAGEPKWQAPAVPEGAKRWSRRGSDAMHYDHRASVVRGLVLEIMVHAAAGQMISLSNAARLPVDDQDLPHMAEMSVSSVRIPMHRPTYSLTVGSTHRRLSVAFSIV